MKYFKYTAESGANYLDCKHHLYIAFSDDVPNDNIDDYFYCKQQEDEEYLCDMWLDTMPDMPLDEAMYNFSCDFEADWKPCTEQTWKKHNGIVY